MHAHQSSTSILLPIERKAGENQDAKEAERQRLLGHESASRREDHLRNP